MQTEAALELVAEDLFAQLAADGVIYAEHTERGLSAERVGGRGESGHRAVGSRHRH